MIKFDAEAQNILSQGILTVEVDGINNKKLHKMFCEAQRYRRANLRDTSQIQRAESVVYSCIRLVRCLYLSDDAKMQVFDVHEHFFEALQQFKIAEEEFGCGFEL
ncbi:hypothetical protein [Photobacterium leiognathi]|uniref:hypothetical protein n=1 Tax=Photobacterium leiognathi TaxID=553611 RepID=UPI0027374659|nr:hypothetical protein [Photobacterium leiognathi]